MAKKYLTKKQKVKQDSEFQIDDLIYTIESSLYELKRLIKKLQDAI